MADKTNYFNVKAHKGDWGPFAHPHEQAKVARIDEEREKQQREAEQSMNTYMKNRKQVSGKQDESQDFDGSFYVNGELML
jgi:hypothetical protein